MAYSAFQEVVYAGRDEQLTAVFLNVDECLIGVHHLLQTLTNLSDMLMLEGLVDAQVVVAPREMSRGAWLLSCACRASDGINGYIFF